MHVRGEISDAASGEGTGRQQLSDPQSLAMLCLIRGGLGVCGSSLLSEQQLLSCKALLTTSHANCCRATSCATLSAEISACVPSAGGVKLRWSGLRSMPANMSYME